MRNEKNFWRGLIDYGFKFWLEKSFWLSCNISILRYHTTYIKVCDVEEQNVIIKAVSFIISSNIRFFKRFYKQFFPPNFSCNVFFVFPYQACLIHICIKGSTRHISKKLVCNRMWSSNVIRLKCSKMYKESALCDEFYCRCWQHFMCNALYFF